MIRKFLTLIVLLTLLILVSITKASPTLTLTVMTDKQTYSSGETAKINGTVTADGSPVPDAVVAIQIDNTTSAEPYLFRSLPTSAGYTGKYPVEIIEVTAPISVKQGEVASFSVKLRNNDEIEHYVTVIPYFQMNLKPLPIDIIPPACEGPIAPGVAYNQTFGKTTVGAASGTINGDTKFASCFYLGIPQTYHANVTKISWRGYSGSQAKARAIIYSANQTDGTPLQLVGVSQETTLSTITQWWNFTFDPPVMLSRGYHWLGLISEPTTLYYRFDYAYVPEINASAFAYNSNLYSDGPSNPFGTPTYLNRSISIYATYDLIQDCGMEASFPRYIPENAPTGTATMYVSALIGSYPNCLPRNGGAAYCPDKQVSFTIISKTGTGNLNQLMSPTAELTSQEGYYELLFQPSPGNFTLYASCYYRGETATATLTFQVILIGDVNGDGKVDGKDLAIASKAFGTKPGDPLWDPRADVNQDNKIDGKDIAIISKNFGQTG
ncbi:MAG: dockerin type I domain-containing protein [Candidatus Bathyarchaeia archaeon]